MNFQSNTIYHIYNQGNNRQRIFFKEENYLFFLKKMREYLLPYADFLCYCLMPNHFHWLVYVRETEREVPDASDRVTSSHPVTNTTCEVPDVSDLVTSSHPVTTTTCEAPDVSDLVTSSHPVTTKHMRTLNESIAILLRSYTRAINKQENRTGALFREDTKAKDGWEDPCITASHPNYGRVFRNWELYGITAFLYIHENPVKAGFVSKPEEWPYSSASDYAGMRNGTLCHQSLARELLFLR